MIEGANERDDIDQEFEYVSVDTESDPSEAATAVTRLIEQDGAPLITGSVSSDVGIQTAVQPRRTAARLMDPEFVSERSYQRYSHIIFTHL